MNVINLFRKIIHSHRKIVHSQNEMESIRVNPNYNGFVKLSFSSSCPLVGVYSEHNFNQDINEIFIPSDGSRISFNYYLNLGTKKIIFRNASNSSQINNFKFYALQYINLNNFDTNLYNQFIFIHTPGKSGSITFEKYLHSNSTRLFISRFHLVQPLKTKVNNFFIENIRNNKNAYNAFIVRNIINNISKKNVIILCGVRKPLDFAISVIYQHYGDFLINNSFNFDQSFNFVKNLLPRALDYLEYFWGKDFMTTYQLDKSFWKKIKNNETYYFLSSNDYKFYFYKLEDGSKGMINVAKVILNDRYQPKDELLNFNMSKDKIYKNNYNKIKKEFINYKIDFRKYPNINKFIKKFGY